MGLRGGADDGGESDYDGCNVVRGPSIGGVGWRTFVGPHAIAAIIDDDDRRHGRWGIVPPPVRFVPSRRTPLVIVDVTNHGQRRRHQGIQGIVICMVEEEEVCAIVLICQVLIQPGVDDGGKRSGVMLVGYVADNIRLGEEEEEALHCDGHNNNNNGYRGGEGGGRGGKGGGVAWRGRGGRRGRG
jgi:hypothetical protein